ncbi:MAG: type II secretion system protein GspD [bacterium]
MLKESFLNIINIKTISLLFLVLILIFRQASPNENQTFEGNFKDVNLKNLLYFITSKLTDNYIIEVEEDKKISITFKNTTLKQALETIVKYAELEIIKINNNTFLIVPKNKASLYKQKQKIVIQLVYTPADYVRNVLYSQEKDTTILVDNFSNSLIIETPVDKVKKTAELVKIFDRPNSEVTTKVYKLDNAKSTEILPIINNSIYIFQEPIIKEQIKINADERTNSIIVTAPKFVINHIEELLSSLIDKKLPQVMIDVQVVELNKDKMKDLGIYPGDNSNLTTLVEEEPTSASSRQISGGGTSGATNPVIVFVKSDKISFPARTSINLQILMLEKQGLARILANPKILTSDGKEAKIFLGDKVPYITTSITSIGPTSSFQNQTVNYVDVGVNLQFLPRVTKDKYVNLKINPQVSYLVTTSPAPWTATREISTELTVKSDETIIIAGLIKEEERKINYKIPLIGDIPIIGSLFKAQKKSNLNTEVIFIIKPQIINLEKDTISN